MKSIIDYEPDEEISAEDQIARLTSWQRNMDNAFKGIMSGPERIAMLNRAVARKEQEA